MDSFHHPNAIEPRAAVLSPDGLDVHDVHVSHAPTFDPLGQPIRATVVRFHIGAHGPFTEIWSDPTVTAAQIKERILAQQRELRELLTFNIPAV